MGKGGREFGTRFVLGVGKVWFPFAVPPPSSCSPSRFPSLPPLVVFGLWRLVTFLGGVLTICRPDPQIVPDAPYHERQPLEAQPMQHTHAHATHSTLPFPVQVLSSR